MDQETTSVCRDWMVGLRRRLQTVRAASLAKYSIAFELLFWRPNEGDFEFIWVPDLSYQTDLHTFSLASRTRERERERELFDNGRNGRWRGAMPRSHVDTVSQSGNSVIEQRRQRAEKRAYKERQAGPVSARCGGSNILGWLFASYRERTRSMNGIRALVFDTFGTLVDWRVRHDRASVVVGRRARHSGRLADAC